jgi:hypothetical protein
MKPALFVFVAALVLAVTVASAPSARQQNAPADGWRPIEGSWSGSGQTRVLPTDGDRTASTSYLSGALVLTGGAGTARGFQSEVIAFDDGAGISVGRAVWTDERGDRIFSRLTGEGMRAGRRIAGTITGGTGRYAGVEGEYAFEWQYVIDAGDGTIQGRAVGLKGRFRLKGDGR